jgi:hypothetical protein
LSVTEKVAAWTPVPVSEIVVGEPVALLATVTVPVSVAAVVGLNTTLNVVDWFGASVTGVFEPVRLNPAPFSLICVICTFPLPVFVAVTDKVEELPVFTFPKLRLVGLKDSVNDCATPVPLSGIAAGEFGALLTTVTLPLAAPADAGENCTLKLLDCPAPREIGRFSVPVLKPVPLAVTPVIVSVPVPLFVNWIDCVAGEPTVTFPKLALGGVIVSAGCTPLPDTVTTALEPCELDIVMLPVMFSEADGLNSTLIAALWPAPMVNPAAIPLAEKSLALTVTAEIVALAVPLLVIVTVW